MKRIAQNLRRLSRRPEARHVGILTSGSVIAQVMLLATTPLLARLFAPESFGLFALMLSISTIGGAVGGLCYEVAVILPRSRRTALSLYRLSFALSLVVPCLVIALLALIQHLFPNLLGRPLTWDFYLYCLAATALTTQINVLCYGHSRAGQYGPISVNKVSQTLLPAVAQIGLAYLGMAAEGLMLGRVLGLLGSEAWLSRKLPPGYRLRDMADARLTEMAAAGRTYKDFLLQVPRQFLVRGATMLPAALLLGSYGPMVAGFYFFAQRLIERPGMLLGDSLSRVPMKQFALRVQERKPLTQAALLYTLAVGTPVILGVGLLALVAHPLFHFVFGARWEPAAGYAVVLAGWAAVRLTSLPMATLTTVLRVQRMSFWVDALFSARVIAIPIMAAHHYSALAAVAVFCGLSVIYHLVIVGVGLFASLRYDRALAPMPIPFARTGETYG
ncbi:MAG TPA: oligosaccharide flippase family protein [Rhizomicrobium sp.]|nr:oligosaccharide flippase family protein [Rhizomicrobium sp.]